MLTDSWFKKLHKEFGKLQKKSVKSKMLKYDGIYLSKKYIPSAKTLYTADLSNITFSYLCGSLPNYLWHFWNHKLFFTTQIFILQLRLLSVNHTTKIIHQNNSNITYFLQKHPKQLVVWKMTRGIWQIFTRTLANVKIGTFMGSFYRN